MMFGVEKPKKSQINQSSEESENDAQDKLNESDKSESLSSSHQAVSMSNKKKIAVLELGTPTPSKQADNSPAKK